MVNCFLPVVQIHRVWRDIRVLRLLCELLHSIHIINYFLELNYQPQRRKGRGKKKHKRIMKTMRLGSMRRWPNGRQGISTTMLRTSQMRNVSTLDRRSSSSEEEKITSLDQRRSNRKLPPLAAMPNAALFRSLIFTTIMSTALLKPAMLAMKLIARHNARFLSPAKNPIIKMLLRPTFYSQFAAGENEEEVGKTIQTIKNQGFTGVILGYAREIVIETYGRTPQSVDSPTEAELRDIELWKQGTLRTLRMLSAGDFLAIKWVVNFD